MSQSKQLNKIFHVFISSTYKDLVEERLAVSEALAKAGYVPEGMEAFPASAQKQMDFIKKIIDRCDYYILIVAGKYGSLSENQISYTEEEYLYAASKEITILPMLSKVESTESGESAIKLLTFRQKLQNQSMVDFWTDPKDLASKVLAALTQAREQHEAIGWVRGNHFSEFEKLEKANTKLTADLKKEKEIKAVDTTNIAGLDEIFRFSVKDREDRFKRTLEFDLTWRSIIKGIGSEFRFGSVQPILAVDTGISKALRHENKFRGAVRVDSEFREQILIQLEALNVLSVSSWNRTVSYHLTELGQKLLFEETIVKTKN